jgi:hypothetical protein
MRVCFLGDSHVASLKGGWELARAEYPHISATFFSAPAEGQNYLAFENGRVVPKTSRAERYFAITSGGLTSMTPGDYDLIVIVSLGFSIGPVIDVYLSHRSDAHNNREGDVQLVSTAYFDEIARSGIERPLAFGLRNLIVDTSGVEVWNFAKPMPCLHALDNPNPPTAHSVLTIAAYRQAMVCGDLLSLCDSYKHTIAELRARGMTVLLQPDETLETPAFTRAAFAVDRASFLPGGPAPNDGTHMNAEYGATALRMIFSRMRQPSPAV